MAVNSVSSSTVAASQLARPQPQAGQLQAATPAKTAAPAEKVAATEQPKTFVNLQGQKTGKVINTSA